VRPDSSLIDRSVARVQIGRDFGLHLTGLGKGPAGHRHYLQAAPETVFEAGDTLLVVGDPDQARRLAMRHSLDVLAMRVEERRRQKFLQAVGFAEVMLAPDAKFIGKTLQEIQFRSRYNATVLAIRRRGKPIIEELAATPLDFGDALLVNAGWPDILKLRNERENFLVLTIPEEFRDVAPARNRGPITLTIIGAMVAAMVFGLLPTVTAAMLAAVLLILGGCVELKSVYRVIDWKAVVLIAGILPLATALNKSGVSQLISVWLVLALDPLGALGMLAVVFLVTVVTGLFISNTATAVLIAPIAINAAQASGVSPQAFAMTVAIACSAAYVTPVSSPVNMLVREPGGYGFMDFVKVGLPLQLLTLVATVLLTWFIYF
jgi:di/tricarboxylate transporter